MNNLNPPSELSPFNKCRWEIGRATLPIYTKSEGKIVPERSGVLFQLADCYFILSCAHEFHTRFFKNDMPIYLPAGNPVNLIPIGKAVVTHGEDEVIDLSLIELCNETVGKLLEVLRFINLSEIDLRANAKRATYLVAGYPCSMTVREKDNNMLTTTAMGYITGLYEGNLSPETEYKPDIHIVLKYSEDGCMDLEGKHITAPHPRGMSGCGIWRLTEDENTENFIPEKAKLVAIQHRYDSKRNYIKGTWLKFAMALIWKNYERLRPAMEGLVIV